MKKLAFFTSSRSDFGLLLPLIKLAGHSAAVHILAGAGHFSASRGSTIHEIEEETRNLPVRIVPLEFLLDGESPSAQAKSLGLGQASLAQWLAAEPYDAMVILGDRWELFAASIPSLLFGIPIAHISGGEVTEGAIDDVVRHAHSKLAHLHFAAAAPYAENLSRMGEEDWRITVCGENGLDSIHRMDLASREEVLARFQVDLNDKGLLVTFHPATLDSQISAVQQLTGLLAALHRLPDLPVVVTAPGLEQGAGDFLARLEAFALERPRTTFVPNFGRRVYLTMLKNSLAVVGNSSSGIVEAPSLGVPTVDIGSRQKNRLAAESVLHVDYSADAIEAAIRTAIASPFQAFARTCHNPYDPHLDGRNSERILYSLLKALDIYPRKQLLCKKFDVQVKPSEWNTLMNGFK